MLESITREKMIRKKMEVGEQLTDKELNFYVALNASRRCRGRYEEIKASILLVEDNPEDYEAITRAFQLCGITSGISHFWTADRALEYLWCKDTPRVDLILLDLNMPGLGGRRILELVKRDPDLQTIPVVVFSTSDNPVDIEMCYRFGANSYIKKPLDVGALVAAVQKIKDYWLGSVLLPY